MTFYGYVTKKYLKGTGPKSDLAEDIYADRASFPKKRSGTFEENHRIILDYLYEQGACWNCIDVFEVCWKEYVKCEKRRLSINS